MRWPLVRVVCPGQLPKFLFCQSGFARYHSVQSVSAGFTRRARPPKLHRGIQTQMHKYKNIYRSDRAQKYKYKNKYRSDRTRKYKHRKQNTETVRKHTKPTIKYNNKYKLKFLFETREIPLRQKIQTLGGRSGQVHSHSPPFCLQLDMG